MPIHATRRQQRKWGGLACGLVVPVVIALSGCEARVAADDQVLHERVLNLKANEAELALAARGQLTAVEHNGALLTQPEGGPLRANEAPMTAAQPSESEAGDEASNSPGDEPGVRSTVYYPDRQTSLDGSLDYYEVFSPAISPFKRVTALDRVVLGKDGRTPGLTTSVSNHTRLAVETPNAAAPDARARDQFWGSVVLDFSAGDVVPLPSVSPESRILQLTTEPTIPLRIEKDIADNYFAVRGSRNTPDQVRVTFLTDAPQGYFGTSIPDARSDVLSRELTPLERSIQKRAERFASDLGLHRGDPLDRVIHKLTEHFRSFRESREPPTNTGDTYLDLARGMKGICRHRSYAFVITAQALGVVTRFVQNEAHSWVEVKLPEAGWMRIDLGGAATGLNPQSNSDTQTYYQPRQPDRLPRPRAYEEAYAAANARAQAAARERAQASSPSQATSNTTASNTTSTNATAPATTTSTTSTDTTQPQAQDAADRRRPLTINLDHAAANIYRGGILQVSGRVIDASHKGVAATRIEISLVADDTSNTVPLGVAVSNAQGYFQGGYGIPTTMPVGEYELRVITPGDDRYLPAVGR